MKRYIIFTISILVLVAAAFFLARNYQKEKMRSFVLHDRNKDAEMFEERLEKPPKDFDPGYDAISIPAFSQKEISGSDFKLEKVLDDNEAYTRYAITYLSGKLKISGIMNIPKGPGPFPVLILNHGYIDPAIYTSGRGLKREQDFLARRGYAVVHPDYRNHAGSDREEDPDRPDLRFGYAEDVINAIRALKEAHLPSVDTGKIGMLGHSMGGGVAQIIAVSKPDLVDAFVLFAPVSADQVDNFDRWTRHDLERNALTVGKFGSPEENPRFWREASPINYFDRVKAPIIFHHGTDDDSCDIAWSERAVKALKVADKDVTLYSYPGEHHEFISAWPLVMERTLDFFDKEVKCEEK